MLAPSWSCGFSFKWKADGSETILLQMHSKLRTVLSVWKLPKEVLWCAKSDPSHPCGNSAHIWVQAQVRIRRKGPQLHAKHQEPTLTKGEKRGMFIMATFFNSRRTLSELPPCWNLQNKQSLTLGHQGLAFNSLFLGTILSPVCSLCSQKSAPESCWCHSLVL